MNNQLLNEKISESGLKKQFIAEKMGISSTSLTNKIKGVTKFDIDEVNSLVALLGLSRDDAIAIFFNPEKGLQSLC